MSAEKSQKILVVFNTSILGGAERSVISQASHFKGEVDFLIPCHSQAQFDNSPLKKSLEANTHTTILRLETSAIFDKASRSGGHSNKILFLWGMLLLILKAKIKFYNSYDLVWANGNKIGLYFYLLTILRKYSQKTLWHFRDYPACSGVFSLLWKFINKFSCEKFLLIANSYSVEDSLKRVFSNFNIRTMYNNFPEKIKFDVSHKQPKTIGVASMLAPWKGIHQIIIFAGLYQKELENLGVEKIYIFGDGVYTTSGEHKGYKAQLMQLCEKLKVRNIEFMGICTLDEIYAKSDILIHPSIKPEPFGRIIMESYMSVTPLITTGLGGAGEIVASKDLIFSPYDYETLKLLVEKLIVDKDFYLDQVSAGKKQFEAVQNKFEKQFLEIFTEFL